MKKVIHSVLRTYLNAYGNLIATESPDENSVTLSFPFHLASNHRIEITVTPLEGARCIVSDAARTIGEMRSAGYSMSEEMKQRLVEIAGLPGLRIIDDHLLLESTNANLGPSIQGFLEASKTIGDAYLVHRSRAGDERDLIALVKTALNSGNVPYRERLKLRGHLESHPFDIVVPPNGNPGVAVGVLVGQNTHTIAQVWAYKCEDIRQEAENANTKLALVYDVKRANWSETSKRILAAKADISLPGDSIHGLLGELERCGVVKAPY